MTSEAEPLVSVSAGRARLRYQWPLVVPGELAVVGAALFEEGVAALDRLVGAVGEAGGFAGEELLADEAIVREIEAVLDHADRGRALAVDRLRPLEGDLLEIGVRHDLVDRAHVERFLGA